MKTAFFCNHPSNIGYVYGKGRRERLGELSDLHPEIVTRELFDRTPEAFRDLEAVFSTWGMISLSREDLGRLPKLGAVFYAAGTVKGFARPLLERGIVLMSAWGANAVSVAEMTLAQILLSAKGYFRNTLDCRVPGNWKAGKAFRGPGNYGETVAVLGLGQVGRSVIRLLVPFDLKVLAYDPYLTPDEAALLNVTKASLEQCFEQACVVSNHMPNIPPTRGILNGELFRRMRPSATFINTGRGAQVVEEDLIAVLRERPDLTALLDVTDPEPPLPESPLYTLPNVQLSSHIAGAVNDEVLRMSDAVIEEFQAWQSGRPMRYTITLDMLDRLA